MLLRPLLTPGGISRRESKGQGAHQNERHSGPNNEQTNLNHRDDNGNNAHDNGKNCNAWCDMRFKNVVA